MSHLIEEGKLPLPAGDPEGGSVTHDTSPVFGTGTLPDEEQAIYDEREATRTEQADAVAEAEDAVARKRLENQDNLADDEGKQPAQTKATKSGSSSSSSSTSSSS